MDVEIDDCDALRAVLGARVVGGDGRVGEQAEAHDAIGLGVVPGRAHLAEGVGGASRHHGVDGVEPAPTARSAASQEPGETTVSPSS